MKVEVDFELCEANGMCVAVCPEVFSLDEQDFLQIDESGVTPENEDALEDAERTCPRAAIRLVRA